MSLSRIQSLRVAAIMEDCSNLLDLLGITVTVQFNKERGPAAAQERVRLTQLKKDCQFISQQFSKLQLELEQKKTFTSLQEVVREEEQKEAASMKGQAKIELEQRKLNLKRKQEGLQEKLERLRDLEQLSKDLKIELDVQSLKTSHMTKIVDEYKEIQLQLAQAENHEPDDQVEGLRIKLWEEKMVHEGTMTFLQHRHEELQQQLQQWRQRTHTLLREKQQRLNNVNCKKTVLLDKLEEISAKVSDMELMVMEDKEEQEEQRRKDAQEISAIKIQSWWRGWMVRLGKYKPPEEEKKGGKKKKNAKKK